MPLKDVLRKYLESALADNEELRNKYDSNKLNQCEAYVNDEARKMLKGRSGAIEDSVVFGWAVSFFVDEVQVQKEERKIIPSVRKTEGHAITDDKQLSFKF